MAQESLSRDAEDLPDAGPTELLLQVGVEFRGGFDGAVFASTVAFVPLLIEPSFGLALPELAGGKKPRPGR